MGKTLIKGGIVVTMDPKRRILDDGAVLFEGNRITAVDETSSLEGGQDADRVIDASGHFVIPGLINAHNHMYSMLSRYMSLTLGEIRGRPFGERLTRWWWPKIEESATHGEAYRGTMLAACEMLRRGCTLSGDLLEGPNMVPGGLEHVARAFKEVGMRGILSFESSERISAENGQLGLEENANLIKKYNNIEDSLVRGWMGIHTPFSSSPGFLREAKAIADELGVGVQTHIAQSEYEVDYIKETFGAKGSVYHLAETGFLWPKLVAGHCIYIDEGELDLLAEHDVKISFNIKSNANGANGLCPVPKMMERGMTVGIGTDGINIMDMFELMLHSAYHIRLGYMNRELIPAQTALEMATVNGAKLFGIDDELGSLEAGKKADIVLIEYAGKPHLNPFEDVYSVVAFGARGPDVAKVFVNGELVVDDGRLTRVDVEKVVAEAWEQGKDYKRRIEATPISPPWKLPTV